MNYETFNLAEKSSEELREGERERAYLRRVFADDCAYVALESDFVCMLQGWEQSKGAICERALAHAIGIPVLYYELLKQKPSISPKRRKKKELICV